ncbi:MAG: GNAT family N-acetyltransferase [Oscillospiraceae bacterium]|nr:GNAT family N-acetyltransferase [Oscillospiraceae bacterium]
MERFVYISNDVLSLVECKPCDDRALYESWLDPDVQRGFNGIYVTSFEEFAKQNEIDKPTRFTAMIRLDDTNEIIGTVGISPPEDIADLTIRIFKPFRKKGYGTAAFALATKYIAGVLKIAELHAGAYADNIGSQKMLKKCGYIPYPEGNIAEKHYITREDMIQMDFIYKPITVRPAVPTDAPDMAEVHMRSWEAAYKDIIPAEYIKEKNATRPAMWQNSLAEGKYPHMVIQKNGKTVGNMCVAPPQDDDADENVYELHRIYLHPDYYRQGIGTQAMEYAYDIALSKGKTVMTVWVLAENANSIRFYEKCGFMPDGKTKILNCGKPLTAIRMRKDL